MISQKKMVKQRMVIENGDLTNMNGDFMVI